MRAVYERQEEFAQYLCEKVGKVINAYDFDVCVSKSNYIMTFMPRFDIKSLWNNDIIESAELDVKKCALDRKILMMFRESQFESKVRYSDNRAFYFYQEDTLKELLYNVADVMRNVCAIKRIEPMIEKGIWKLCIEYFAFD